MKNYVGSTLQVRGAEQYVLQNGKGDGMHFIYVRNGLGLEVWISVDRAGDISRLTFEGKNMGYFSPGGYVAPAYYDDKGAGFLKSFTAGFFTTCGLTTVGTPCTDGDEELPLHGTVSHIPAQILCIDENDSSLTIKLKIEDAVIFGRKLALTRTYVFSYTENTFELVDTTENQGDNEVPYLILYHCNMGYPLLTENSIVKVPNSKITPRTDNAAEFIDTALVMEKPQANYTERCYFFDTLEKDGLANAGIYSPDFDCGMVMSYKKDTLPCFTEWKMMGRRDYVIGLEPGNCIPDGREAMRKMNMLKMLKPEESETTAVRFTFMSDKEKFEKSF